MRHFVQCKKEKNKTCQVCMPGREYFLFNKNLGTSMVEHFTVEEIAGHISLLRGEGKASKADKENNKMQAGHCTLCNEGDIAFGIHCYACGVKVKRNHAYYSTASSTSDSYGGFHWCAKCYAETDDELVLDSFTVAKRDLVRGKNTDESKEPWVECDICGSRVHQVRPYAFSYCCSLSHC